ncbi:hypothetical protein FS749_012070 [Ceratobasidium sp. UAMH 11750]|nr:hypothetical protein FS749_012070 [Ceratobasidium sp. UAMH 11750]
MPLPDRRASFERTARYDNPRAYPDPLPDDDQDVPHHAQHTHNRDAALLLEDDLGMRSPDRVKDLKKRTRAPTSAADVVETSSVRAPPSAKKHRVQPEYDEEPEWDRERERDFDRAVDQLRTQLAHAEARIASLPARSNPSAALTQAEARAEAAEARLAAIKDGWCGVESYLNMLPRRKAEARAAFVHTLGTGEVGVPPSMPVFGAGPTSPHLPLSKKVWVI